MNAMVALCSVTSGAPLGEMGTVVVIEVVVAMPAELALGASHHLEVAEMTLTSVVNDTYPGVPAAWRELPQGRAADDGVLAIQRRATAEVDHLFLADVDPIVFG
jgi:hypothetical protein